MSGFWQSLSAIIGEGSFAWTVLFVVSFACVLAFVFDATIDIVFPMFTLGFLTAIAEHVMRNRDIR
jgi:hypothetical protein